MRGVLLLFLCAGCPGPGAITADAGSSPFASDAGTGPSADGGRSDSDASAAPDALVGADVGTGARCFADVELATLGGGRERVVPRGVFPRERGWLALYSAFSHDAGDEHAAVFLDHDGHITARQPLEADAVGGENGGRWVLDRFLLSAVYWDDARLYEIGDAELRERSDLLSPPIPGRVEAVVREDDRLRVLSSTWRDTDAGTYRFAYTELSVASDGSPVVRTAELPPAESLGSVTLVEALGRFSGIHGFGMPAFGMRGDSLVFAFPSATEPHVWNVVRVALDRTELERGLVSWVLEEELRWVGPDAVFALFPEREVAITGRWIADEGGDPVHVSRAESYRRAAAPIELGSGGVMGVERRDAQVAVRVDDSFTVYSGASFEAVASTRLGLVGSTASWGEGVVLELGGLYDDDGARGILRCHVLDAP